MTRQFLGPTVIVECSRFYTQVIQLPVEVKKDICATLTTPPLILQPTTKPFHLINS